MEKSGYKGSIVSIEHLPELKEIIESFYRQGLLDEELYKEYLANFIFKPPDNLPDAKSLIVVSARDPQTRLNFNWKGQRIPVDIPPTYLHAKRINDQIEKVLTETLEPEGYRVAVAVIPKKTLAVRSGLAKYGKNNITFVPGMGSFHRLAVFYSDLPCDNDDWQEPRMLELCEGCEACLDSCPSGAIIEDRFLIRAERCIVYHNEKPGEVPFPSWIEPSWHNCFIGCMRCQTVCPENKDFLDWFEGGVEFSAEETELLLAGTASEKLPPETARKLEENDLIDMLDTIPRNLLAVLESKVGSL